MRHKKTSKNRTYYFFNDIMIIEDIKPGLKMLKAIKMLQHEKIDDSEGIGMNKSNKINECMLCHYWYFENIGFKFQPYTCNESHDLSMMIYDLDDFMILNVKGVYYRCIVYSISKNATIKLLNNSQLDDKGTV